MPSSGIAGSYGGGRQILNHWATRKSLFLFVLLYWCSCSISGPHKGPSYSTRFPSYCTFPSTFDCPKSIFAFLSHLCSFSAFGGTLHLSMLCYFHLILWHPQVAMHHISCLLSSSAPPIASFLSQGSNALNAKLPTP